MCALRQAERIFALSRFCGKKLASQLRDLAAKGDLSLPPLPLRSQLSRNGTARHGERPSEHPLYTSFVHNESAWGPHDVRGIG